MIAEPSVSVSLPAESDVRHLLRLAAKVVLIGIATCATVIAVVMFPDGNDYNLATLLKHERLDQPGPKVVFIGGSNLAFGLESGVVERSLGRRVVNMGMNGYFGIRFMLDEVRPSLQPGDVAVLAFEYDNYFKSVDGAAPDLLMVVKANPSNWAFLTWRQRGRVLWTAPYAAQQKIIRWIREGLGAAVTVVSPGSGEGAGVAYVTAEQECKKDIVAVETLAGFDEQGDLNSHIGRDWRCAREQGLDLNRLPLEEEAVTLLADFAREMRSRGVTVVMSYTPVISSFYHKRQAGVDAVHKRLLETGVLAIPSPPSEFVFSENQFFDTVYHLNAEGRQQRTAHVISGIEHVLNNRSAHSSIH